MRCCTNLLLIITTLTLAQPTLTKPSPLQCALAAPQTPTNPNLTTCLDSSTTTWHPWTHKPHCIIPAASTPWCVFTHAAPPSPSAHGGPGLSVITTPDEASSGAALNPLLLLLLHSFTPQKLYYPPQRPPYEVRDIPGKGKGVVANRRIEKGRVVLVDYVAVLAAAEYPPEVGREEVRELLAVAVGQLGEPWRVEGLARRREGRGGDGGEGMSEMEDVMLTNSFGVTVEGKEYMGLFVDLARFNHACRPNAFMHFSETTLAMTIWSARDIEAGEEITITYSAAGLTSKERHESLETIWGFTCQCALCTAPPEVLRASDEHREEIRSLQGKVVELAQKGEFNKAIDAAERLFVLVEEEGLTEQMGGMHEVPARLYYHVGNLEKALEYTLKAKHEIDGHGVPSASEKEHMAMLMGFIERIEREIEDKQAQ